MTDYQGVIKLDEGFTVLTGFRFANCFTVLYYFETVEQYNI